MNRVVSATRLRIAWCSGWLLLGWLGGCEPAHHTVGTIDSQRSLRRGSPIDTRETSADQSESDDSGTGVEQGSNTQSGQADASGNSGGGSGTGGAGAAGDGSSSTAVAGSGAVSDWPISNGDSFACSRGVRTAFNRRLDMYLMVDSNITLPFTGAWDNLVDGVSSYAGHPRAAGTGVGIRFFGLECSAGTYAMPDVEVDLLPDNAREIRRSFPLPFNFSPMLPALQGAIAHARSRANAEPQWKQVVVFVTDGFSTDLSCLTSPDGLVEAAQAGLEPPHPVPTYVVALNTPSLINPLDPVDRIGPLNDVARAGATERARQIDLQEPASVMVETLLDVQREAEPCEYAVPDDLAASPEEFAFGLGDSAVPEPRLKDEGECEDGRGYFLDWSEHDTDPEKPVWAVACPATCDAVRESGERPLFVTPCTPE